MCNLQMYQLIQLIAFTLAGSFAYLGKLKGKTVEQNTIYNATKSG